MLKTVGENLVGKENASGTWLLCPNCRGRKVLKLLPETRATAVTVFCRQCKQESVVDVVEGGTTPRVILR